MYLRGYSPPPLWAGGEENGVQVQKNLRNTSRGSSQLGDEKWQRVLRDARISLHSRNAGPTGYSRAPRDGALLDQENQYLRWCVGASSLLHSVGTEESNLYPPRSASDADLADENAFARRVDSKSKSGCAAAPKEVIELFRLGRINEALSQGWHQNTPAKLPEAYRKQRTVITGNPQYPQATGKSRKKFVFNIMD